MKQDRPGDLVAVGPETATRRSVIDPNVDLDGRVWLGFRIASNTKTMTAALIVLLAQDRKLKFSDPIFAYVAGVPNGENITVAELLKRAAVCAGIQAIPSFQQSWMPTPRRPGNRKKY